VSSAQGLPPPGSQPPLAANDSLVGAVVADKYRVIDLVARGGMGRIYRAEQAPLGREVALKILTRPVLGTAVDDVALEKRFRLEAATCARLRHPNTVTVFDYGAIEVAGEQTFYMVMEFVRGRTVSQALRAEGPFSPARTVRVAHEICRSLREAHRAGIVHRDLKPSNVMLAQTEEGEAVKVLDFGVAKVMAEGADSLTTEGCFVGSPRYTAPEQVRQEQIDGRADLYALGVMMFEMLSGAPPFSSSEPVRTLLMHLNDAVPALHGPGGVPAPVEALVRRLLEKDPRARYADADAVVLALRATGLLPVSQLPKATGDLPLEDDLATEDKPPAASRARSPTGVVPGPVDTSLPTSPTAIGPPKPGRARAGAQVRPEPAAPVVTASPSPAAATGRWLVLAAGAGVMLLVALAAPVAVIWWYNSETEAAAVPAPPEVPVDEALRVMPEGVGGEAPRPLATLRVTTTPEGASVYLDGKLLGPSPLDLSYDPARSSQVEVRQPGYLVRTLSLAGPDDDGALAVELEKIARPTPPSTRRPASSGDDIRLER